MIKTTEDHPLITRIKAVRSMIAGLEKTAPRRAKEHVDLIVRNRIYLEGLEEAAALALPADQRARLKAEDTLATLTMTEAVTRAELSPLVEKGLNEHYRESSDMAAKTYWAQRATERCTANARKGTGTGMCNRPLDEQGYCDRPTEHIN